MALTHEQIGELLRILGNTEEHEVDCDECLPLMAAHADGAFSGEHERRLRVLVEQHLSVCPECSEEHELLHIALDALGTDSS